MLRNILQYLKTCLYTVILQENGVFSWFIDHYPLSFGWDIYFVAEINSVLHYASDKVQFLCLLWPSDFIDPLYTKSSHCAVGNGLLYGIFLYEKYGVDSMRRTTVNMLYSQICLMLIFSNILAIPMAIYGYCLNEISGKFVQVDTRDDSGFP